MKSRDLIAPVVVGSATFGILYALGEHSSVQAWLQERGFGQQLHDLQVKLNALLSSATTAIVAVVKAYLAPERAQDPDEARARIELPPEQPTRNWRDEYHRLYLRAKALLDARDKTKDALQAQLVRSQEEVAERRGRLKITLYCGLALALGSCVATVLGGTMRPAGSTAHVWWLTGVYFGIPLVFAFAALISPGAPRGRMPILMFGVAAIYVNTCALLISVPYSLDRMFGPNAGRVFGMHVAVWIGVMRLLILPSLAVAGSVVGTIAGGLYLQAVDKASTTPARVK